jgi:hypothetical protein
MNIKDTTEPTLSQYQEYNGDWSNFLDEQHYLDTVADGKCRVRHLYAAPQPVNAPELTALKAIACQLRKAGATIPAENRGTIESAIKTGLSIALLLVEDALAKNGGAA